LGDGSEGGKENARVAEECCLGYHFVESCCFEELVFVRDVVVRWLWFEIDGNREIWVDKVEFLWPLI
jgi:hypothetical protein